MSETMETMLLLLVSVWTAVGVGVAALIGKYLGKP